MQFRGKYWFLSNFYPVDVVLDGLTYHTSEAAFQAQKCVNPAVRRQFAELKSAKEAKRLGQQVVLREDWDDIKVAEMRRIIDAKFSNSELAMMLAAIGGEIVEDNHWNDTFWGRCDGIGENWLGRILMDKRAEILDDMDKATVD